MPAIKVTVTVEQDGVAVPGFPFTRRIQTQDVQAFAYTQDDTGTDNADPDNPIPLFSTLPVVSAVDPVRVFILRAAAPTIVRFADQTDEGVQLQAGGLVILVDASIDATVPVAIHTSGAELAGLAAGT